MSKSGDPATDSPGDGGTEFGSHRVNKARAYAFMRIKPPTFMNGAGLPALWTLLLWIAMTTGISCRNPFFLIVPMHGG